jgi:PAS domain S-box-containing protein
MRMKDGPPAAAAARAFDRRWVPTAGAILITVMLGITVFDIVRARSRAVEDTGQQLLARARIIAEQTQRTLQSVDIVLRQVATDWHDGELSRATPERLHTYLRDQAVGLTQIGGLALADARGDLVAASWAAPPPKVNVASQPGFEQLRDGHGAQPMLAPAFRGPIDGQWIVPMARRLASAGARFDGVVVARIAIGYFQDFYERIQLDSGSMVTLLHHDSTLLARFPRIDAALGKPYPIPVLHSPSREHGPADAAVMLVTSPVDGVERYAVVLPIPDYPVEVIVSQDTRSALAAWRSQALGIALRTLVLAALAAALLVMLQRKVTRLDAARAKMALSEERYALAMTGLRGGHWVWDVATDQLFGSGRLNELFGVPADYHPTTRREYFKRVTPHPDDRDKLEQIARQLERGEGTRHEFEYRVLLPNSEVRWIATRSQAFADADGHITRVAGVSIDITASKKTEEALRASEERFALAVAGSDDGIWLWDYEAGTAFESQRARELQGLGPGPELQPLPDLENSLRVHPEDRARRLERIRAHLAGETAAYENEYRVQHGEGSAVVWRWIRVRALCTRGADGQPRFMAGSVSDVDERKRAEEALRASEQRFALAVAGANDGILDWDRVNDRLFASERALHLMGLDHMCGFVPCPQADWVAQVMPRIHPEDAARLRAELEQRRGDATRAHDGEYRIRRADGKYHWVRFRGRSVLDAEGREVRWAGSLSDIDALKQTEEALRRSDERYQLAVLGSTEGLWDWDLRSDLLFLSPRCQELIWPRVDAPLQTRRVWIERTEYHPDDRARVRAALLAHLRGKTKHLEIEYRVRRVSDGAWHWVRQRGVALRDEHGVPYRMAGSMEDISDRKNAEAERERLEQQLRQSQKLEAMGTLAGGIAHDFNNILSAILGYGEMARKRADDGTPIRRHIDAALAAGTRAKSLVERILAFSRSGMGEQMQVHVQSVVGEALELQRASLPAGIGLVTRLEAGNAAVFGDPTQIHQVVMNLTANAVQAIGAAGRLEVAVDCEQWGEPRCVTTGTLPAGAYVRLAVSDNGVGIPARVMERIFDPFFTTKEIGVGTGLGLSLVHGIVSDLGGGIDVQSRPGQGTTMTVYVPQRGEQLPPAPEEEPAQPGRGETVLLVDDEVALVRLGEEMLADLGYEPVGFTSSLAALASFRRTPERYDLVLSDESMPEMTGSELVREIRALRPDIPIVIMTGHVTKGLTRRARDLGVADVLTKPLVASDIARGLAQALRAGATAGD